MGHGNYSRHVAHSVLHRLIMPPRLAQQPKYATTRCCPAPPPATRNWPARRPLPRPVPDKLLVSESAVIFQVVFFSPKTGCESGGRKCAAADSSTEVRAVEGYVLRSRRARYFVGRRRLLLFPSVFPLHLGQRRYLAVQFRSNFRRGRSRQRTRTPRLE